MTDRLESSDNEYHIPRPKPDENPYAWHLSQMLDGDPKAQTFELPRDLLEGMRDMLDDLDGLVRAIKAQRDRLEGENVMVHENLKWFGRQMAKCNPEFKKEAIENGFAEFCNFDEDDSDGKPISH